MFLRSLNCTVEVYFDVLRYLDVLLFVELGEVYGNFGMSLQVEETVGVLMFSKSALALGLHQNSENSEDIA